MLQALFALQDIELQIVDIRRQLERKQRLARAQTGKLKAARDAIEAERTHVKRAQAEFDELDLDLKGRSANISRLREHLNTVRTNRDYAAVLAKLNNEKADVSRLENRALGIMQAIDARKQELAEHERAESAEAERLRELQAQLEHARESFASRLEELQTQRREALVKIDRNTVTLFKRLSERYDGEALAEVERPDPGRDEFICAGCHMSLRTEVANTLKSRDEIVTCKNCGRILFIRKDT
ncbi:MAG: zinc ribbon domain-containing protein [Phycisphaerae bacterium]